MVKHRLFRTGHRVISQEYRGVAATRALDHAKQLRRSRYQLYLAAKFCDIEISHRAVRIVYNDALGSCFQRGPHRPKRYCGFVQSTCAALTTPVEPSMSELMYILI